MRGRGFAVAALDWRGQGGSSRTLADPLKVHIGSFTEYDADLSAFVEQVVLPLSSSVYGGRAREGGELIALAHSMGAHILLRGLHANPDLFSAAVMTAPMLAVSARGTPAWLVAAMTELMNLSKTRADDYVFGMKGRDPLRVDYSQNLVSQDPVRWNRAKELLAKTPDIRLAGPTWGWLKQAYASMAEMAAPGYAEAITTRSLIFGAGSDRIVLTAPIKAFAARMPNATYVEIPGAEHEIMMERDSIRAQFWKAFDAFLAA